MAQEWEYKSVVWKYEDDDEMNALGADEWEIVAVIWDNSNDFRSGIHHGCAVAFLKRHKP